MGVHKWQIRYSLFLSLWATAVGVQPILPSDTLLDCEDLETSCADKGGFVQLLDDTDDPDEFECTTGRCFRASNESDEFRDFKPNNKNPGWPNLTYINDFPPMIGDTMTFICSSWGSRDTENVRAVKITGLPEGTPVTTKRVNMTYLYDPNKVYDTDVSGQWLYLNITLTPDLHGKRLYCGVVFRGLPDPVRDERVVVEQLYIYEQTQPVIEGPKQIKLDTIGSWTCTTDKITYDVSIQFGHQFSPGVTTAQLSTVTKAEQIGNVVTPRKFKVTTTLQFRVSADQLPAFVLQCKATSLVLSQLETVGQNKNGHRVVEIFANAYRVNVIDEAPSMDGAFILVGIVTGVAAFITGVALVMYYVRKGKADMLQKTEGAASRPKDTGKNEAGPVAAGGDAKPQETAPLIPSPSVIEASEAESTEAEEESSAVSAAAGEESSAAPDL